MRSIIIQPVISEKSMMLVGNDKYTFIVAMDTTKKTIRKAIEKLFNVHVVSISTSVVKGKSIRTGMKRIEEKKNPWKKAIVAVKKGEKIDMFETGA